MKTLLKEPLACFVLLLAIISVWLSFEIKWYRDKKAAVKAHSQANEMRSASIPDELIDVAVSNTNDVGFWRTSAWIDSDYQIGSNPRILTLRNINRTPKTNSPNSRWLSDFDFTPTNVVVEFELDRLILTTNKGMLEVRFRK